MNIIVSGGRDYRLTEEDYKFLDAFFCELDKDEFTIINLGSEGIDEEVNNWAIRRHFDVNRHDGYDSYKTAHRDMVNKASIAILFPGGKGTNELYKLALNKGIDIINRMVKKDSSYFLNKCIEVQKERGAEYEGNGSERSFEKMAIIFNAYTGKDLTAAHMALIQQILKDVRQFSSDRYHEDSCLDGVSYASLKAELLYKQYNE